MVHLAFYMHFTGFYLKLGSRQQFNSKFITNVYIIVLKQLNGIDS